MGSGHNRGAGPFRFISFILFPFSFHPVQTRSGCDDSFTLWDDFQDFITLTTFINVGRQLPTNNCTNLQNYQKDWNGKRKTWKNIPDFSSGRCLFQRYPDRPIRSTMIKNRKNNAISITGEVNGNRFWSNCMDPRCNGARHDHDAGRGILLWWARTQEKSDLHDHPVVRRLCTGKHPVGTDRVFACVWQ